MKTDREIYIADLLAAYVGHPNVAVCDVADALGISKSLVYAHKSHEGACPTGDQLIAYMNILPASFANAVLGVSGLAGAYRADPLNGCAFRVTLHANTLTSGLMKRLSEAVEDGVIDHRERRVIPTVIRDVTAHLNTVAHSFKDLT